VTDGERQAVRAAILHCRQDVLDRLVFALTLTGEGDEVESEMRATLATAPHDVQLWWDGECNCDGHLN